MTLGSRILELEFLVIINWQGSSNNAIFTNLHSCLHNPASKQGRWRRIATKIAGVWSKVSKNRSFSMNLLLLQVDRREVCFLASQVLLLLVTIRALRKV